MVQYLLLLGYWMSQGTSGFSMWSNSGTFSSITRDYYIKIQNCQDTNSESNSVNKRKILSDIATIFDPLGLIYL